MEPLKRIYEYPDGYLERLLNEVIFSRLDLDLTGIRVLTEAATGPFAVTAALAARAGAAVQAVAADSRYGSLAMASAETMAAAEMAGAADKIEIVKADEITWDQVDIVTNLGPLRPLNKDKIEKLTSGSVVALMYDAREFRPDEIDRKACRNNRVGLVGVNEEHPRTPILSYCGSLILKIFHENRYEVSRNRLALIGRDIFTPYLANPLVDQGARVDLFEDWSNLLHRASEYDAVIFSDYNGGLAEPAVEYLSEISPECRPPIIQFTGGLDIGPFKKSGWKLIPDYQISPRTMWRTLGDLGIRPVVELHAAALKAAALEWRGIEEVEAVPFNGLRQVIAGLERTKGVAHVS